MGSNMAKVTTSTLGLFFSNETYCSRCDRRLFEFYLPPEGLWEALKRKNGSWDWFKFALNYRMWCLRVTTVSCPLKTQPVIQFRIRIWLIFTKSIWICHSSIHSSDWLINVKNNRLAWCRHYAYVPVLMTYCFLMCKTLQYLFCTGW